MWFLSSLLGLVLVALVCLCVMFLPHCASIGQSGCAIVACMGPVGRALTVGNQHLHGSSCGEQIYDGDSWYTPSLGTFSGGRKPLPLYIQNDTVKIRFTSDHIEAGTGFAINTSGEV